LANAIKGHLDGDVPAKIDLTAKQIGDDIVITTAVSDLKNPGEDTRRSLVLIEETVRCTLYHNGRGDGASVREGGGRRCIMQCSPSRHGAAFP
jgi:hypothetical protein